MNNSDTEHPALTDKPRKRKKNISSRESCKRQKLSSHKTGPDCKCSRHKCFQNVTLSERETLIEMINSRKTKDEQDALLSTCIHLESIERRRPRKDENDAQFNQSSYSYHVPVLREVVISPVSVCYPAFLAMFGITNRRGQTLKKFLLTTGNISNYSRLGRDI